MRSARRFVPILSVVALVMFLAPPGRAEPQVSWHEDLGGSLRAVARGPDGSIYVAGQSTIGWSYVGTMLLARLTPAGDVVWTRTWDPRHVHPNLFGAGAVAVDVAENGVVYVVGFVQRYNCEGGGWFLRAYGAGGRLLHANVARKSAQCDAAPQRATDVAVRDGLVVVTGENYGCCGGEDFHNGWVRAFDAALRLQWKAPFEPPAPLAPGWMDGADGVSIGAMGNIVVSGWAATGRVVYPEPLPGGTLILEKISADGTVLWTRRPGLTMGFNDVTALSARGNRLMVVAKVPGAAGWLGRFTVDGDLVWSRSWGITGRDVGPSGVSVSASGSTWVLGVKRDPRERGMDISVRLYGRSGDLLWKTSLQDGARVLDAGGVAAYGQGAMVTGTETDEEFSWDAGGGHVWRLSG